MYYQEGNVLQNEEALNTEILRVVGEVETLHRDVEKLVESWQESFGVAALPRQTSGDFIWAALTSPPSNLLPFLEEGLDESAVTSDPLSDHEDYIFPYLQERELESPSRPQDLSERDAPSGNEGQLDPQPEIGVTRRRSVTTLGAFDQSLDRAIQQLYSRLLSEGSGDDSSNTANTIPVDEENGSQRESGNSASTLRYDFTPPQCALRAVDRTDFRLRRKQNLKRVNRIQPKSQAEESLCGNASRTNEINEFPTASHQSLYRVIDSENGSVRSKPELSIHINSDVEESIARLWIESPESSPAEFLERNPQRGLQQSNSTPQLHEIPENTSLPAESLRRGVASRQIMVPWLESNASALVKTTHTLGAPNQTTFKIPDKCSQLQALFYEHIGNIYEEIEEMREFALRENTPAYKHLTDTLRCLVLAKAEIGTSIFKPWDNIDFGNSWCESNQRAQQDLRHNAIITGVPEKANENVIAIVKRIGYYLGRPIDDMYIKKANRLSRTGQSSPILVKFTYPALKDALVSLSSTLKLYTNQLDIGISQRSLVSIQDQLTPIKIHLLEKAKVLKDNGFIDLWVDKGNIWVQKSGSNPYQLDCKAKLFVLLREFQGRASKS